MVAHKLPRIFSLEILSQLSVNAVAEALFLRIKFVPCKNIATDLGWNSSRPCVNVRYCQCVDVRVSTFLFLWMAQSVITSQLGVAQCGKTIGKHLNGLQESMVVPVALGLNLTLLRLLKSGRKAMLGERTVL